MSKGRQKRERFGLTRYQLGLFEVVGETEREKWVELWIGVCWWWGMSRLEARLATPSAPREWAAGGGMGRPRRHGRRTEPMPEPLSTVLAAWRPSRHHRSGGLGGALWPLQQRTQHVFQPRGLGAVADLDYSD